VKKRKGLLFASILAAIVATDFYLFGLNIFAFGWHMRHGFHRETGGFRFKVPLFYQESDSVTMNQFSIDSFPSPIRSKSSSISMEFPPWSSNKPVLPLPDELAPSAGLGLLGQHSARLASRSGKCIEYMQQGGLTLSAIRAELQPVWITCQFGDVSATFDGTRNAVPEFYEFLESAREVKR
jgi:hypothetical protein